MRVSRDSGRTWLPSTRVLEGDRFDILSDPGRYPPCKCPRCGGSPVTATDLFPRWPVPPDSCAECARHVVDRFDAQVSRDRSRVTDMNVLILRHHPELRRRP
ncbi:hypothetical protein ACFVGY_04865 [Streptomyces sp. NPDC127106]|uniref:hypothetical protein n=1 Tax=Streptomyces sp. NPDC127106 TaxID=3345360 RepID=UPI00363F77D4